MGRSLSYKNLTGGLNVENDIGTINQTTKATESPDMCNVEYYGLGGIQTMAGNIQFGDTLTTADTINTVSIVGGWDYIKGNNHHMIITASDGSVRRYNSVTNTFDLIYTFPSATSRCSYVNMNNGVVMSNGVDDLVFYEYGRKILKSGTVSVTDESDTITGTSTQFTTELSVGDYITIEDVEGKYKVTNIDSDTQIKVTPSIDISVASLSGKQIYLSDLSECNAKLIIEGQPEEDIRGLALQYYQGRLFVGSEDGSLYYSSLGTYKFEATDEQALTTGGGVIPNIYNDTSEITALGLYSSYMMIHKRHGSYILDGKSSEPENWEIKPYSNITCRSQQSFTVFNRLYFVYSDDNMGIFPLTMQTIYGDKYVGNVVSEQINNLFQELRTWETDKIFIVRMPEKRQVCFYCPFTSGKGSNIAIIYDLHTKTWLKREVPQNVTIAFEYDNQVYIGSNDGKVFREFYGQDFDGEPIVAYWKSPWFDFGNTGYYKSFKEFALFLVEEKTCNFKLRVRKDISSDYIERKISSEIYDTDALVWDKTPEEGQIDDNLTYWGGSKSDKTNGKYIVVEGNTYQMGDDGGVTINGKKYFLPAQEYNENGVLVTIADDKYIPDGTGNTWVKTGITVRRFPTERQFFYNYQIEFTTEDTPLEDGVQGFAIYGFDIRNIQLEETPL